MKRVLAAVKSVAAYAVIVDAKDERGRRFYESHGFISLPSRPNRLFLLTETAAAALQAAAEAKEGERSCERTRMTLTMRTCGSFPVAAHL